MAKQGWDLAKTKALQAAAAWLRKRSDALVVVIVRSEDVAISAHPLLAPRDAWTAIEAREEEFHDVLQAERVAARELAARKLAARKLAREEKRAGRVA